MKRRNDRSIEEHQRARQYDPVPFTSRLSRDIRYEMSRAVECGHSKAEAALIVAQCTISLAIGYTCGAMGKEVPTKDQVGELTSQIIGLVSDLPVAPGEDNSVPGGEPSADLNEGSEP